MTRLLHTLAHWFGWNHGTVESWWRKDGTLMIGFRCSGCGRISGVHESVFGTRRPQ